jgi:plastocyanin
MKYVLQIIFAITSRVPIVTKRKKTMKTIITSSVMAVSLALCSPFALAKEKEHEEESISQSDVPAAVQKAAETEAKGGKIVRWEKEGASYEVVIKKSGKEWGVKMDATGKVLSKHDESKEKGEKGEKY